jgi:DNA-binding GntR family transcriptional regulator
MWVSYAADAGASDAVYATLRDAIIEGVIEPQERLYEELLAQRFAVSRTPIREALLRLEAEQLVSRNARRGFIVRKITVAEVFEIYAVREVLDGLAARLAAVQASPPDIARLRWINEQLGTSVLDAEYGRTVALNIQFHDVLCEIAHNSLLSQFAGNVHARVRRFPRTEYYPGEAELAVPEHERIIQAIEQRDPYAAEQLARAHIARTRDTRVLETSQISLGAVDQTGVALTP